jgi:hypothetical protein
MVLVVYLLAPPENSTCHVSFVPSRTKRRVRDSVGNSCEDGLYRLTRRRAQGSNVSLISCLLVLEDVLYTTQRLAQCSNSQHSGQG